MPKQRRKKKKSKSKRDHPYRKGDAEDEEMGEGGAPGAHRLRSSTAKFDKSFTLDDNGAHAPSRGFLRQKHKAEWKRVRALIRNLKEKSLHLGKKAKDQKKKLRKEVKALEKNYQERTEKQLQEFDYALANGLLIPPDYTMQAPVPPPQTGSAGDEQRLKLDALAQSLQSLDVPEIKF